MRLNLINYAMKKTQLSNLSWLQQCGSLPSLNHQTVTFVQQVVIVGIDKKKSSVWSPPVSSWSTSVLCKKLDTASCCCQMSAIRQVGCRSTERKPLEGLLRHCVTGGGHCECGRKEKETDASHWDHSLCLSKWPGIFVLTINMSLKVSAKLKANSQFGSHKYFMTTNEEIMF